MYNLDIIAGFPQCSPADIELANVLKIVIYIALIASIVYVSKVYLKKENKFISTIIGLTAFITIPFVALYAYGFLTLFAVGFCGGVPPLYPDIAFFIPGYPDNADYAAFLYKVVLLLAILSFLMMTYSMWLVNKMKGKSKTKRSLGSKTQETLLIIASSVFIVLILVLGGWSYLVPYMDFLF